MDARLRTRGGSDSGKDNSKLKSVIFYVGIITALLESNGNRSIFSARLPKAVKDYSNVNLDASIAIFINSRVKIVFIGYI